MDDQGRIERKPPVAPTRKPTLYTSETPAKQAKLSYAHHEYNIGNLKWVAQILEGTLRAFGRNVKLKVKEEHIEAYEGNKNIFSISYDEAFRKVEEIRLILSSLVDREA
ncbi:hypothetical protein Tlie_0121 [Thermovirga lienii DSM 17291]|uniref:Uncharacterized protein n=2 Tax=Bacteria TaxID=2 RepID=G7V5W2_THELD|nr:hypothetical protein [Thermovirga lienii]MDN5318998.1 hypothetical protein [Thermovirga sp.]AER65867.1 hypothetical protein Tlie_0121 [Thermovirga lienii DSM 17291]KUK42488.1 MAG: Uncharacterized protein XD70_0696 [Thermovirga lienii]MDN5368237.1 hypothetical protein [Thermovirga sp.]HCD71682.1 hypothetical protein [Thermovirga lienii]